MPATPEQQPDLAAELEQLKIKTRALEYVAAVSLRDHANRDFVERMMLLDDVDAPTIEAVRELIRRSQS
jgi:hypothetical protein